MVQQEELIKIIKDEGLNAFEVYKIPKIDDDSTILFKELNEFVRFCKINDLKNVFYTYIYLEKEEYIISEELQEQIEKYIYKLIKKEIKEHNNMVETVDFTRPIMLNTFSIFQGSVVCNLESDYWNEEINLMKAENRLEYLQEKYKDILDQKENEREEKLEELKNELKEQMLNDETFLICSNKSLRRNYAETLIKNKKMKKYLEPFLSEYSGQVSIIALAMFVEVVWAQYKNRR